MEDIKEDIMAKFEVNLSDVKFENKEDFDMMVISPNNIENYDPHFLCFDSYEIFKEAADEKLLNHEDLIRFRSVYKKSDYSDEKKSEKSNTFSSEYIIDINNPFSSLKKPGK